MRHQTCVEISYPSYQRCAESIYYSVCIWLSRCFDEDALTKTTHHCATENYSFFYFMGKLLTYNNILPQGQLRSKRLASLVSSLSSVHCNTLQILKFYIFFSKNTSTIVNVLFMLYTFIMSQ